MRQPRFRKGQWIIWKETTSICRVRSLAQSPERFHWYAVYAPSTAVFFVGKEQEFRPLSHQEMRELKRALRVGKMERWERLLRKAQEERSYK